MLALMPLLQRGMLPSNDENLRAVKLTELYGHHFSQWDFFPIWASSDAYGHGSPLAFYYHRVFYSVGGLWQVVLDNGFWTLVATLACFMVLGGLGLYLLARLWLSPIHSFLLSGLFLLSTYSFYDWLTRGAMAEFSFLMVLPFFARGLVLLARSGKLPRSVGVSWIVLFFSHNILAIFALVPGIIAYILGWRKAGRELALPTARWAAAYGVIFGCWYAIARKFNEDYDVAQGIYSLKPTDYGVNPFFPTSQWYETTIGPLGTFVFSFHGSLNLTLYLLLGGLAIYSYRRGILGKLGWRFYGLLGLTLATLVSMTPLVSPLWGYSGPLGSYLQFPFRLQVFVVVSSLMIVAILLARSELKSRWVSLMLSAALMGFLLESPLTADPYFATVSSKAISPNGEYLGTYVSPDYLQPEVWAALNRDAIAGVGEYFPPLTVDGERLRGKAVKDYYAADPWPEQECQLRQTFREAEPRWKTYEITCDEATDYRLPDSYSWLSEVRVDGYAAQLKKTPDSGHIELRLLAGTHSVEVRQPRIWDVLPRLIPDL